ncbi:hypothetical protein BKE38_02800 [Pseudoroseomonas deserti]|uniref:Uncharacterized protein n=1 Tax=Teichococcus deserti TaxID=1817963 RepID=A0A1V2H760_9PROT|nr:hypothetical protein [Pseudoroseomonas deserti]ONG58587.1 hypothetical protein BKE38_02800 [Pseudoroseomonas deserti]
MGELVDDYAGKVAGELVRAADWNGLIAAIETQLTGLESGLGARIDALTARATAAEAQLATLAASLVPLQGLATALRQRLRRIDLQTTRATFAVGERGEIVARIAQIDGAGLDLANAATRPWIDFVTLWGSLKPASGFVSRSGSGGRSVSVQVNAAGEARVLLRAEQAESFAEEQELEINAVMQTMVGGATVAQQILSAPTPASDSVRPAFGAISAAYERADTNVMQSFVDGHHLRNSVVNYALPSAVNRLTWRDYPTTVLAFLKPDADPASADGAQAVGAIEVIFRDWVHVWTIIDYLPPPPILVDRYRDRFRGRVGVDFGEAVKGIFEVVQEETLGRGLLGRQKMLQAAQQAVQTLAGDGRPVTFMEQLVDSVSGGLQAQQGLLFSQAVTPMMAQDVGLGAAIGKAAASGPIAAGAEGRAIRAELDTKLSTSEVRILDNVRAETAEFSNQLLREDGPVRRAENIAIEAQAAAKQANTALGGKADMAVLGQFLNLRPG